MRRVNKLILLWILMSAVASGVAAQRRAATEAEIDKLKARAEAKLEKISYRETTIGVGYHDDRQPPYSESTLVMEYQRPNRERMVYEENDEKGISRRETIDIGNKEYSRDGTGPWKVAKKKRLDDFELLQLSVTADESNTTVRYEYLYLGKEDVNGIAGDVYQATTTRILHSPPRDIINPSVRKYWFDRDGRLIKTQVETTDNVSRSLHREVVNYQYDIPIKLEAPIK